MSRALQAATAINTIAQIAEAARFTQRFLSITAPTRFALENAINSIIHGGYVGGLPS
jgi:hypothetical protein